MWRRVGAVALMVGVVGCGDSPGEASQAAQECTPQVRFEGTVYTEIANSSASVASLGMADEAACADVGEDARGAYFPDDPRRVEVWKFDGYSSSKVVGVRRGDLLGVYVSESLDPETASSIAADLEPPTS